MRKVGFAYNPAIAPSASLLERGMRWCSEHGVEGWAAPPDEVDRFRELGPGTDVVCVLGGDGTLLRTARAVGGSRIPVFGVNLGRVGFLAKGESADLERTLEQIGRGEYVIEERLRIDVGIVRADGRRQRETCVNDVVAARGGKARVIQLEVEVSGSHLATYVADGVVVATPTGSTAYSFSAGGPILDPSLRNMVVTPVAAYLSAIRSVVVSAADVITVTRRSGGDKGVISLDGQVDLPMGEGDRVEVRALDEPLRLIEPAGSVPFYDLLRTKATLLPY